MVEDRRGTLELTRRILEASHGEADEAQRVWRGLCMRAGDGRIIVSIDHVSELSTCENITPVPLTHPWIRGLTSLRGQLLAVVDLGIFIGADQTRLGWDARIVALADQGLNTCLLVGGVSGLKAVPEDRPWRPVTGLSEDVAGCFSGRVEVDDQEWTVLDVPRLVADRRFRNASRVATERAA